MRPKNLTRTQVVNWFLDQKRVNVMNNNFCLKIKPEIGKYHSTGYFFIILNKKNKHLHRLIAIEKFGEETMKNKVTRHICNNRWCVNPEHLNFGTDQDNANDKVLAGTSIRGEKHPNRKINKKMAKLIKSDINKNISYKEIAKTRNVSYYIVVDIARGKNWNWL